MKMRPYIGVVLTVLLMAAWANAGTLYSWTSGEVLTSSQLNANFSHIHNNMVGGHGPRLVDADVSLAANIARHKLASYRALPLAYVKFSGTAGTVKCDSANCAENEVSNVTDVTRTDAGVYAITHTSLGDTEYGVVATAIGTAAFCWVSAISSTLTTITCNDHTGAATDVAATVSIFDADATP